MLTTLLRGPEVISYLELLVNYENQMLHSAKKKNINYSYDYLKKGEYCLLSLCDNQTYSFMILHGYPSK